MKVILAALFLGQVAFADVCSPGLEAFKKEVHPVLVQRCVNCHGDGRVAPPHSGSNPVEAYKIAKNSVNFENIEKSYFLQLVKWQHWRGLDPTAQGISYEKAKEILSKWRDGGEADCPKKSFSLVTEGKAVERAAVAEQYRTLRYKLGGEHEGSIFEIDVKLNAIGTPELAGSYIFKNPRLSSPTDKKIDGFYLILNDKFNPLENIFSKIKTTVYGKKFGTEDKTLPGKTLSTRALLVVDADGRDSLKVEIGFEGLEDAKVEERCFKEEAFAPLSKLSVKNCLSCHNALDNPATTRMSLGQSSACESFTERLNRRFGSRSTVLDYAIRGSEGHPKLEGRARYLFLRAFRSWSRE